MACLKQQFVAYMPQHRPLDQRMSIAVNVVICGEQDEQSDQL
ncbi:hypothetical protein MPC1_820007 [Methylocella tundrae]|jgi:hypothetical protein|nr:hypothetical protein MPC1_820007 [Methylocella tundrae]